MSIQGKLGTVKLPALQIGGDSVVSGVTRLIIDNGGNALLCTGTSVPADNGTGYAKGCLFIDTDVAAGTTGLYCNKGVTTACAFTAITQA